MHNELAIELSYLAPWLSASCAVPLLLSTGFKESE